VHRFLVKDPDVGWVSIESESHIPINDRAWRVKLDQQIAEMKLKDKYSFSMEFKGESYLAMILPGMERVNEEVREGPHPSDYDASRLHSYTEWLMPPKVGGSDEPMRIEKMRALKDMKTRLKFSA
jgi:hypothetical protein